MGSPWITLSVSDTGPGIPVEDRAHILDDLGDARTMAFRRAQRTGLGLPLARRIVEMHGGQISLGEGHGPTAGTLVSITLPCADPA
jgi:signal transduction histidine kinase